MSSRKNRITAQDVDALMSSFQPDPTDTVGAHLAESTLIDYARGAVTPAEQAQHAPHLSTCPVCAREVARLKAGAEKWQGESGTARLARLRERSLAAIPLDPNIMAPSRRDQLRVILQQAMADLVRVLSSPQPALAAPVTRGVAPFWSWRSPDGVLRARAVAQRNGDWVFYLMSADTNMAGERVTLVFNDGAFQCQVELRQRTETEAGGQVKVSGRDRPAVITTITVELADE